MVNQNWLHKSFTRRQMMGMAALGGAGAAIGGGWTVSLYTGSFFDRLTIAEYTMKSPQWPKDYPDLTIAFLSDLHVGCPSVGLEELEKIVKQVNALKADIILLGGDYLSARYVPLDLIAQHLAKLTAPLGVFSVLGNHDWSSDGSGIWKALQKHGIQVLENTSVFVPYKQGGFWVVGLADYLMRTPEYQRAMAQAKGPYPKIVLSHDPITFKEMPENALLQLSGHTHGGQVTFPGIGPVISPTPGTPLDWFYGLVEKEGRHMIVTSGVGTSRLPLKNTPCEVVKIIITHG